VSVELLPDAPAAEVLTAIRAADDSAIDTVFCVDEIYHRDAWGSWRPLHARPAVFAWRWVSRT
jgi:hypothetical protein